LTLVFLLYLINIFEYQEAGGVNSALLLASVGTSSYTASLVNPAMLTQLEKNSVGLVYAKPFQLDLIQYNRIFMNYHNFGIGISRLGQSGYQEYNLSLSAGFSANKNLSYGFMLKGLYLDLAEYGQSFVPALNIGISYKINRLEFGSVLENANNPLDVIGMDIPWAVLAGVIFQPVKEFLIGLDLHKTAQDENISIGTELKPLPILAVRLGTKTNPFIISGGLGVTFKNISLDYAVKFHSQLRETSVISLSFQW
jgi:hypothetical protein